MIQFAESISTEIDTNGILWGLYNGDDFQVKISEYIDTKDSLKLSVVSTGICYIIYRKHKPIEILTTKKELKRVFTFGSTNRYYSPEKCLIRIVTSNQLNSFFLLSSLQRILDVKTITTPGEVEKLIFGLNIDCEHHPFNSSFDENGCIVCDDCGTILSNKHID